MGAPVAKAQNPRYPAWEQIAAFYSGGNMRGPIRYDYTNSNGTTGMPGSGEINLNPRIKASLDALLKYGPKSQRGMVLGALGLSTLIHEALHNRANTPGLDFSQEAAPTDLGWRLIPDALQRFFGIKMDSPWGQKYLDMVMKELH